MSTRIIGLLFLSVAAQIFLTQEDGEVYFAQMKTRCGQGMIFWLGRVGYYKLVIVGTGPNLWIFEILENGIWYLFLIGICENLFCAMEDVKGDVYKRQLLERFGYKVAILSQPDWRSAEDFRRFGKPRLGFLINSGNVDSMVNHFSVFKHRRKRDEYSPGGKAGLRPDRALIVYSNRAKEAYRDVPVILGGLEASLRRLGH